VIFLQPTRYEFHIKLTRPRQNSVRTLCRRIWREYIFCFCLFLTRH